MKTVRATNTLYYYDGPQVIEARDSIGGHYIAVMVEPTGAHECYLVVGVAPERLHQFCSGKLDLRTLLSDADDGEWYLAPAPTTQDRVLALERQHGSLVESGLLPEEGFVLNDRPTPVFNFRESNGGTSVRRDSTVDLPPENPRMSDIQNMAKLLEPMIDYHVKLFLHLDHVPPWMAKGHDRDWHDKKAREFSRVVSHLTHTVHESELNKAVWEQAIALHNELPRTEMRIESQGQG